MIFNWKKNCEDVLKTFHFKDSDSLDKKRMRAQQCSLVCYLKESGKNKREIFDIFKKFDNSLLCEINDEYFKLIEFNKLYQWSFLYSRCLKLEFSPIVIYKEEIDFINKINCEVKYKQLMALLLCYYKAFASKDVNYTATTRMWCRKNVIGQITSDQYYNFFAKYNTKYKLFSINTKKVKMLSPSGNFCRIYYRNTLRVNFCKNKGKEILKIYNLENNLELYKVFELLKGNTEKCSVCECEYIPSVKAKRHNLCENCYRKKRNYIKKNMQVKLCKICGKEYIYSGNCQREDICKECYFLFRKKQKTIHRTKNH